MYTFSSTPTGMLPWEKKSLRPNILLNQFASGLNEAPTDTVREFYSRKISRLKTIRAVSKFSVIYSNPDYKTVCLFFLHYVF